MKLRNKKTGQIIEWEHGLQYRLGKEYKSIKEFAEDWEDCEDGYFWYINEMGNIKKFLMDGTFLEGLANKYKQIGNYFETKEEAEKAVEKLKAWKRLKDKGFRFTGYGRYDIRGYESPHISFMVPKFDDLFDDEELVAGLDICFGGEE